MAGTEGLIHVLAGRILKSLLHERTQWQEFSSTIAKSSEKQRASPSSQACVHTWKMILHESEIPACWMPLCSLNRYKSLLWATETAPILSMKLKGVFLQNCMLWLWGGTACNPEDTLSKQSYPRGKIKGVLKDSICSPNKKLPYTDM